MKTRVIDGFLGALLLSLAAGCSAVYAPAPVGERPHAAAPDEWEGVWIHGDGAVAVSVVDETNGTIRLGWIEAGDEMERKTLDVVLRESGDWVFASARDPEKDGSPWLWGRLKKDGARALLWAPDTGRFRALVEQGALPGSVGEKDGEVLLGELRPADYEAIRAGANGVLFDWDDPILFRREVPR